MQKIKRRFIKEKEAKKLLSELFKNTKINLQELPTLKPPIEIAKTNNEEIFFINKEPIFAKSNNKLFPTLASDKILKNLPKATVNMGAIPHICNGADIMAPGIVHYEGTFNKENIVIISDERHQKPIAIAIALYNTKEAKNLEHGKILKNIHYIGDKIWNTIKQLNQTK
ncbi:MAG: DUF1947 domain-containing protein [Candidatus Bathyarchaeota archaeon]|nr:DUF1947 domain-containing protein [Candidatus Bathyarchaeota archaeon]MDH5495473.1 DUF1947 domain-containing protein [Candidatus Bathyarchaeota archaeon]